MGLLTRRSRQIAARIGLACTLCLSAASPAWPYQIDFQDISPGYDPFELNYVGADGRPVWTIIMGNPFGAAKEDLDTVILDAMAGSHFGQEVRFSTQPAPNSRITYRVIMLLNGNTKTGGNICRYYPSQPLGPGDHGDKITLVGVFCRGEKPLTLVSARMSGKPLTDPEFERMVKQVTINLFPTEAPDRRREHRRYR